MKVSELIEKLSQFDPDLEVRIEYDSQSVTATNVYEEVVDDKKYVAIE